MEINLKHGKVLRETNNAYNSGKDVIIHQGGTGSGKTFEICLFLFFYLGFHLKNEVITVVSESYPHLKIGVLRYFKQFIAKYELSNYIKTNQTDNTFIFPNGTIIELFSADRIDKALGARRYMLFANELDCLKKEIFEELARRSKYIIADFNPTAKFWLEQWLTFYDKNIIIKSNYLDNVECPEHEKIRIEKRASLDSNFKRIHIDCEYGNSDDLVFKPENIILIDKMPEKLNTICGLDFGWAAPSVLVEVGIYEDNVYINEIFYRGEMNERDFANELSKIDKSKKIKADSEDPRMINYIYTQLKYNIHKALKGKDSIQTGIGILQGKKIHITKTSINTISEFRGLTNAKDKMGNFITGKYNGEDHAIDAVRYALEDNYSKPTYSTVSIHI
jgi:phage terminase large subunit